MRLLPHFRVWSSVAFPVRLGAVACSGAMALALTFSASAQQPAPTLPDSAQQPAQQTAPVPSTDTQPTPQPAVTPEAQQPEQATPTAQAPTAAPDAAQTPSSAPDSAQQPAQQPAPAPSTENQPAQQQPDAAQDAQQPEPATSPATPTAQAPTAAPDAAQTPSPSTNTDQPAAQQTSPAPATDNQPAPQQPDAAQDAAPPAQATPQVTPAAEAPGKLAHITKQTSQTKPSENGSITEEELKQLLLGKALFLRGGYLDNNLTFSEHGALIGHSPQGSYTLSGVQVDRVRLTKHKLELEGARYGLHFLGALPYEDPTKAVDRVKITPKKKVLRITIDREMVVTPKKKKENKEGQEKSKWIWHKGGGPTTTEPAPAEPAELSEADQLKASIAATPAEERPADPNSVTTTTSPAHAANLLRDALDRIFAQGFDERLMASMPEFWKLYYQAVAAKSDYRPTDPAVLRQNTVDKKALLVSKFEPESTEYAQAYGIAGMALYHAVIGADGKSKEIAVGRPIGFGLDENAAAAIRKATFEPAIKDGQPVPVMLDLVVQFRIYSKRTSEPSKPGANKSTGPILPGPYSVPHPPRDPDL